MPLNSFNFIIKNRFEVVFFLDGMMMLVTVKWVWIADTEADYPRLRAVKLPIYTKVVISRGCSMSSNVRVTLRQLFKAHNISYGQPKGTRHVNWEIYHGHKNPLYKPGMSKGDLVNKTMVMYHDELVKLLPDVALLTKGMHTHTRPVYVERFNHLQGLICNIRDCWAGSSSKIENLFLNGTNSAPGGT